MLFLHCYNWFNNIDNLFSSCILCKIVAVETEPLVEGFSKCLLSIVKRCNKMKKIALSIILAMLCIVTCAFSACNGTKPNVESPPAGEYNDPAMDDIYE